MREKNDNWLKRQIDQHWLTVTLAAILIWSGFRDTDAALHSDVKAIRGDVAMLRKDVDHLTKNKAALTCAVRAIDRVADRAQIDLPCELETPE